MTGATLALYGVFLLVAFGWRSWIQYRRTGDSGYRGFSGRASWIERVSGILFALGIVFGLLSPVLRMGQAAAPLWEEGLVSQLMGLGLIACGTEIALLAQANLGASWRIGVASTERPALVTSGLFGHVRNPFFAGVLTANAGLVLIVPATLSVASWCALTLAVQLQVRWVEEPYLVSAQGQAYREYARVVGRFAPKVGRLEARALFGRRRRG